MAAVGNNSLSICESGSGKIDREQPDQTFEKIPPGSAGPVTVLVCRKWDVHTTNGKYINTDFLFSDKRGNIMHCFSKSSVAQSFVENMHEDVFYSIWDFEVVPNKDEYRIMKDAKFILEFLGFTSARRVTCDHSGFVRHPFSFVRFEDLVLTNNKYFIGNPRLQEQKP